ncbi:hypothetical protein [Halococcus saccharolyticus]|uniref:Uncharacterized protein n=1 Tax=Halococcus saccharolyticus DSM 5350 TaxID=1227455 RepID=M0ME63_9EURY|nr:hypothetical protein [Halococcus saccharolyticus]EMA42705.1 hypothetical protein C449_16223 [Halococcus saccharolyticus DSM 5350]
MSDDTPEEAIERGLAAYFASDVLEDIMEALDIDALAEGAALDDAVEYEQLGRTLGKLIGRAAAKGVNNNGLLGRIVTETAGTEVGGRAGEAAAVALVEHGDANAAIERARGLMAAGDVDELADEIGAMVEDAGTDGADAGPPADADWTEIEVEERSEE